MKTPRERAVERLQASKWSRLAPLLAANENGVDALLNLGGTAWNIDLLAPSRARRFLVKWRKVMAKRKRKPGRGSKLRPIKDYRSDEYLPYIFKAETGILKAWGIEPDMTDGNVRQALRELISQLKESSTLPRPLTADVTSEPVRIEAERIEDLIQNFILYHLRQAFEAQGPLSIEDLIGVLKTINHSIGAWNVGMNQQGYLNYLEGFLGKMGVTTTRQIFDE